MKSISYQSSQKLKSGIFLFLIFVVVFTTYSRDIYVSPNGKDNYPGTKNNPIQSIQIAKIGRASCRERV